MGGYIYEKSLTECLQSKIIYVEIISGIVHQNGNSKTEIDSIKVLHTQLIFQLQSFPYDPKYIDLYRVNANLPQ